MRIKTSLIFIILINSINFIFSQDCIADDSTEGIQIFGNCFSIQNTDTLIKTNQFIGGNLPEELGQLINLTYLDLSDNNFSGSIPSSIGNLSNLEHLDLSNNSSGFMWFIDDGIDLVPPEIGNLSNLRFLNLERCFISEIPIEMANLINLDTLKLSSNPFGNYSDYYNNVDTFQSPLPTIYSITNLKRLELSFCLISDSIHSGIANLDQLEHLNLWGNELYGEIPDEFWSLTNLISVDLGGSIGGFFSPAAKNNLTGIIPTDISNLINLKDLNLDYNNFTGNLPPQLFELDSIKNISAVQNFLSGQIPETICIIDSNVSINLAYNSLCPPYPNCTYQIDFGPQNISNCESPCGDDEVALWTECFSIENTTILNLPQGANFLFDSLQFLPQIGQLVNLTELNLSNSNLFGEIPSEIGNLVNLESLDISRCPGISGPIPPEIGNLVNLTNLDISGCENISGSIPPEIGNLVNLVNLNLSSGLDNYFCTTIGKLSGEIPSEIGNLVNLESLKINNCKISGLIPPEIGNLSNLRILELRGNIPRFNQPGYGCYPDEEDNNLSGPIPPEIGNLTNLQTLNLASNNLSGPIPENIWNISQLTSLDLCSNSLEGDLSSEIENLNDLSYLNIGRNNLTGNIPDELFNIIGLEQIILSANYFSGEIPNSISNLTDLRTFYFDNNNLNGSIPNSICQSPNLFNLNSINFRMSMNQLCPPYPACVENYNEEDLTSNFLNWSNPGAQECFDCESNFAYDGVCAEQSNIDFLQDIINENIETINVNFDANNNDALEPFELDVDWNNGFVSKLHFRNLDISNLTFTNTPNLTMLQEVNLTGNQLSLFPTTVLELNQIKHLDLSSNQINDIIPSEIGNLVEIEHLKLQNNEFFGEIPVEIGNLQNLKTLYMQDNHFSGLVPEDICDLNQLDWFSIGNNNLCPPYPFCIINDMGIQDTAACIFTMSNTMEIPNPSKFFVGNNYPNPFNPSTSLLYSLPYSTTVKISVYDIMGKIILEQPIVNKDAGHYNFKWNGKNQLGKNVPAGMYFFEIYAGDFRQTKKMILLK